VSITAIMMIDTMGRPMCRARSSGVNTFDVGGRVPETAKQPVVTTGAIW
jgi:hypothetical protein